MVPFNTGAQTQHRWSFLSLLYDLYTISNWKRNIKYTYTELISVFPWSLACLKYNIHPVILSWGANKGAARTWKRVKWRSQFIYLQSCRVVVVVTKFDSQLSHSRVEHYVDTREIHIWIWHPLPLPPLPLSRYRDNFVCLKHAPYFTKLAASACQNSRR